jgi:spore coat polysaccharide biosynthesis protein SpsF
MNNSNQDDFLIIVQARMGSSRFPGKSFCEIKGIPTLQHLIDSLLVNFSKNQICIATSILSDNDVIRNFCLDNKISVFSGDEHNVASRFYEVLKSKKHNYFVRLNGDSPLFCSKELKNHIYNYSIDINIHGYSTIINRNYPKGNNFEIFKTKTFLDNYCNFEHAEHFEHVTSYFYENLHQFNIEQIKFEYDGYEDVNLCFDTIEDFNRLSNIFDSLTKPHFEYSLIEKCYLYRNLLK